MPIPSILDPWHEKGIPLDRQYRSWKQIVKGLYRKQDIDAYSRVRVILMNGLEAQAGLYSHSFARMTDSPEIKACGPHAQSRRPAAN